MTRPQILDAIRDHLEHPHRADTNLSKEECLEILDKLRRMAAKQKRNYHASLK